VYFKENMNALNLAAPENLFGNLQSAIATATAILTQIDKYGNKVTVAEIARAGTRLEQLVFVGSCCAAYYAGAVIGSIAVATGRSLAGGTSIADVLFSATRNEINRPWLITLLHHYPGIYSPQVTARDMYRYMAPIV
jgi:hypothetical protein